MRKATATYNAPEGDADVCEMGGVSFKSGESVELKSDKHDHLINKLPGNQHFDIEVNDGGEEEPTDEPERAIPRRGRPPKNPASE